MKTTEKALMQSLLKENDYQCNADGRNFIAARMPVLTPRTLEEKKWKPILEYAEEVGGCKPGTSYSYPNAQGTTSQVKVTSLYDLPENMVNPYLVCFSGMMTAHLYAFEVIRWHVKKQSQLLPLLAIGKSGNKGLFDKVFNRTKGIVVKAEYEAYLRALCIMAPENYIRSNQRICEDMSTAGNFDEMYLFAQEKGLQEATFILCSGNYSYDKRLLAEGMLQLKKEKYANIKINLVLVHCPLYLNFNVPEGHISEIHLGYAAASLGPLMKDTVPFGTDATEGRYLMPGVDEADWSIFEELITNYSNMGWPDYQEILYNIEHKTAVENVIASDLYARQSFTAKAYDEGIISDIAHYQQKSKEYSGGDFLEYLRETPNSRFF